MALGNEFGNYIASTTLAALPTASSFPVGTKSFATDIGLNGTEMVVSSSGTWIPHNGRALLSRLTLPVVKAPTIPADASASANGAITFGTAVGTAFAKCYCYFAANVVNATQPAGFYYMEMSSTTAAIVYNNLYTPAAGTYPTEPTSKTAFAGAVPGGAGSTAEITAFIYTLNGGLLGLYGTVIIQAAKECNSSAGIKTFRNYLSSTMLNYMPLTTTQYQHAFAEWRNLGSNSLQRSMPVFSNTNNTIVPITSAINTAIDQSCSLSLQCAVATDWAAFSCGNINVEVA